MDLEQPAEGVADRNLGGAIVRLVAVLVLVSMAYAQGVWGREPSASPLVEDAPPLEVRAARSSKVSAPGSDQPGLQGASRQVMPDLVPKPEQSTPKRVPLGLCDGS